MASVLLYITHLSGLMPLLLIIIRNKKQGIFIKSIFPVAVLMFVSTFYEFIATHIFHIDSSIWFRIYLLLDFACIYYFFKKCFPFKFKRIFAVFALSYSILWLCLWFVWTSQSTMKTDSYLTLTESVFVYTFVVLWFRDLFDKAVIESLWETPEFYFICGLVFYFSSTTFLFLLGDNMLQATGISFETYWLVNVVGTLILRLLLTIGIWKSQRK